MLVDGKCESPQHWPAVRWCISLCMESSDIWTRERSPSCLPYTLYLLLSVTRARGTAFPTQFLVFIASCPVVAATCDVCIHLRAFALNCPVSETLFCQIFSVSFLTLFTHLPIMDLFIDTYYVNACPITLLYCSSESLSLPIMLFNSLFIFFKSFHKIYISWECFFARHVVDSQYYL